MMRLSTMALPMLALIGCGAPAADPAAAQSAHQSSSATVKIDRPAAAAVSAKPIAAPAQQGTPDGAARSIRLPGGATIALASRKIDRKQGVSNAACEVSVGAQRIATIGSGDADAYTCGTLVEAGALPARGAAQRIGLIYRVSSPSAAFRTAIILVGTPGAWRVDPASIGAYDDTAAAASIAALAKAAR